MPKNESVLLRGGSGAGSGRGQELHLNLCLLGGYGNVALQQHPRFVHRLDCLRGSPAHREHQHPTGAALVRCCIILPLRVLPDQLREGGSREALFSCTASFPSATTPDSYSRSGCLRSTR